MTASELKYHVEQAGHDRHFFTPKTMKFFGDRMSNYGVCESVIDTYSEKHVPVCMMALALLLAIGGTPGPCADADEGTDLYYQCQTGDEIDLGVQDEADTATSKRRE